MSYGAIKSSSYRIIIANVHFVIEDSVCHVLESFLFWLFE